MYIYIYYLFIYICVCVCAYACICLPMAVATGSTPRASIRCCAPVSSLQASVWHTAQQRRRQSADPDGCAGPAPKG